MIWCSYYGDQGLFRCRNLITGVPKDWVYIRLYAWLKGNVIDKKWKIRISVSLFFQRKKLMWLPVDPSENGCVLKGNNLHQGSKFFLSNEPLFTRGGAKHFDSPCECIHSPKENGLFLDKCVHYPNGNKISVNGLNGTQILVFKNRNSRVESGEKVIHIK